MPQATAKKTALPIVYVNRTKDAMRFAKGRTISDEEPPCLDENQ